MIPSVSSALNNTLRRAQSQPRFFMLDKNNDGQLASDDIVDYVDITEKH